jgi:LacI family transcriptional regulator
MDELGFVVNGSARTLRAGKSHTLGVIALDLSNPYWGEVVRGIESSASAHGYSVLYGSSEEKADKENAFVTLFEQHRVDAILIATVDPGSVYLENARGRGTRIVLLDRADPQGRYASISHDELHGARMVAHHLVERGHRAIGFINGPHTVPWCRERSEGLRGGLEELGLSPSRCLTELNIESMTARAAEPAVEQLLSGLPAVSAVFCANDMIALAVLKRATEIGMSVPGDVSVIGYDDSYFASLLSPALTTVRQHPFILGARAAELVLTNEDLSGAASDVLASELISRESVRAR